MKHVKAMLSFSLAILSVLMAGNLNAQTVPQGFSQLLFPMNDQGGGARAIAMGSAVVAMGGDVSCLQWNPAGLATLPSNELSLDHSFYLQDLTEDVLSFATPQGEGGTWGFSVGYINYGTLTERDENGISTGSLSAGRWEGQLAWAQILGYGFSGGLGINLNYDSLPGDVNAVPKV
jgi:hypothetical protein